jgi:hypothetical protein
VRLDTIVARRECPCHAAGPIAGVGSLLGVCVAILGAASSAGASPAAVDLTINVGAAVTNARPALAANGSTVTVARRNFYVFLDVSLIARCRQPDGTGRARDWARLGLGRPRPDRTLRCHAAHRYMRDRRLAGSVFFRAGGASLTKRFAVRLP